MQDVLDKPPVSAPPELPPFLTTGRGPERRPIHIVPDIRFMEHNGKRVYSRTNNWITIVYFHMNRFTGNLFEANCKWEYANSHSRIYRQWLETYEMKDGIPPHISFGGAIESGKDDPTFHSRWKEYARETFF